jgi:hypothetical protein
LEGNRGKDVNWIDLAQDRVLWQASVNMVMHLLVPLEMVDTLVPELLTMGLLHVVSVEAFAHTFLVMVKLKNKTDLRHQHWPFYFFFTLSFFFASQTVNKIFIFLDYSFSNTSSSFLQLYIDW